MRHSSYQYRSYNNGGNYFWLFIIFFFFFGGFRILLALIGLFFSLLPLIVLGSIAYFFFKAITRNANINQYLKSQTPSHNQFIELFARVAAHLIAVDGKIEPVEIQTFKNFFNVVFRYDGAQLLWVEDLLKSELRKQHEINTLISEINSKFNYDIKLVLMELLYQIALSDFEFHIKEQTFINQLAILLNISKQDQETLKNRYLKKETAGANSDKHYQTLGLKPGASKDDVKKAYKKLVKKFHPDVVAHLGDDLKQYNQKKMADIIKAYEALAA